MSGNLLRINGKSSNIIRRNRLDGININLNVSSKAVPGCKIIVPLDVFIYGDLRTKLVIRRNSIPTHRIINSAFYSMNSKSGGRGGHCNYATEDSSSR